MHPSGGASLEVACCPARPSFNRPHGHHLLLSSFSLAAAFPTLLCSLVLARPFCRFCLSLFSKDFSANHLGNEPTGKDSKHGKLPESQTCPSWSCPQVPPGMSLSGSLMQPRSEAKAVTQTLFHGMPILGALSQRHGFMIKDQENSACYLFLLEAPNVWKRTESFEKYCGLRSRGTLDNPKPV